MAVLVVLFGVLVGQLGAAPAHCRLSLVERAFEGTCAGLFGETPTLSVARASSVRSGRYRGDQEPTTIFGGEMRMPSGAVQVELELYAGGTGILRPDGLAWLVVSSARASADLLEFDIDTARAVPPSDLDREIVIRAASILSTESVWDRADDRRCSSDDRTWSIYCAMIRATEEITGGTHHRRPAMEAVRQIVSARSAGRGYEHRLRDYNNDPSTRLADVRSLFEEALSTMTR